MDYELDNPTFDGNDGQADVVDQQGAGVGDEPGAAAREPDHQTNAAMKAARLAGRSEAEKALQKQYDAEIAGMGVPNPYTGKPFSSFEDFKEYGKRYRADQLKERAEKTGKPVEELEGDEEDKKFLREMREASKAKQQAQTRVQKDIVEFAAAYPDVDLRKLAANEKFKKFCGSRLGKEPVTELYEAYKEFSTEAETEALARKADKDSRSTGAGGTSKGTVLTSAEQGQLDAWNARYPEMKMTAQEWNAYHKK